MTLQDYIKQLTLSEREQLAAEVHASTSYLNKLVVKGHAPASAKLAKLIFFSKFNEQLPKKKRFTAKDSVLHVRLKMNEKAKTPKKYKIYERKGGKNEI